MEVTCFFQLSDRPDPKTLLQHLERERLSSRSRQFVVRAICHYEAYTRFLEEGQAAREKKQRLILAHAEEIVDNLR